MANATALAADAAADRPCRLPLPAAPAAGVRPPAPATSTTSARPTRLRARLGLRPPRPGAAGRAPAAGHPLRQGWQAGRAAFGSRTLKPTRAGAAVAATAPGGLAAAARPSKTCRSRRTTWPRSTRGAAPSPAPPSAMSPAKAARRGDRPRINHRAGYAAGNLAVPEPARAGRPRAASAGSEARLAVVLAEARQGRRAPARSTASPAPNGRAWPC